jgi:hypothetical protein
MPPRRRTFIWVSAAILAAGTAAAGFQAQVATSRREPQFANARAESWKSTILPNQPLSLHRHDHGRAIIALTDGTLDLVNGQGETMKKYTWEAGKAYWLDADPPGQMHADLNRGTRPIEVIVVEMKD